MTATDIEDLRTWRKIEQLPQTAHLQANTV